MRKDCEFELTHRLQCLSAKRAKAAADRCTIFTKRIGVSSPAAAFGRDTRLHSRNTLSGSLEPSKPTSGPGKPASRHEAASSGLRQLGSWVALQCAWSGPQAPGDFDEQYRLRQRAMRGASVPAALRSRRTD